MDDDFLNEIFASDEAHFPFDGYVNKQNYSIYGSKNPQIIKEISLYSKKKKNLLSGAIFSLEVRSLVRRCG